MNVLRIIYLFGKIKKNNNLKKNRRQIKNLRKKIDSKKFKDFCEKKKLKKHKNINFSEKNIDKKN